MAERRPRIDNQALIHPPTLDVQFAPALLDLPPADADDAYVPQWHHVTLRQGRLELTPPLPRMRENDPVAMPVLLLNENFEENHRALELKRDEILREDAPFFDPTPAYLRFAESGFVGAKFGAWAGSYFGPVGAAIGGLLGAGTGLSEAAHAISLERLSLASIVELEQIFGLWWHLSEHGMDADELLARLSAFERRRHSMSPAAVQALVELELILSLIDEPALQHISAELVFLRARLEMQNNLL